MAAREAVVVAAKGGERRARAGVAVAERCGRAVRDVDRPARAKDPRNLPRARAREEEAEGRSLRARCSLVRRWRTRGAEACSSHSWIGRFMIGQ